jgi:hypothetical protein
MLESKTHLLGIIACSVCLLAALPGCQDPEGGSPWDFDTGQPDAMGQTDAGVDADSTTTRDAFPFDLPEPPNIDAGDWMPPGASEECTPRPEAEGRCYTRFVPQSLDHYPKFGSLCRVVEYQRIDEGPINSLQQYRIDRNDCGDPVRVLSDYDSWEKWQDGEPLDGLPSATYGYVYDAQGHPNEFVLPGEPVEVDRRFYFDDNDRLSRIENVDPDNNRDRIEFEYDSLGNRTKLGGTERSYDSECRITLRDRLGMDSPGPTTWSYREVDDGLVVIRRSEFRNEVEAGSRFVKTKRQIEDGRLVKTVSWRQQGPPSRETPYEEDWIKVGKSLFYYDAEGRRMARVEYSYPESDPPATPQWVTKYYYDCAWAE